MTPHQEEYRTITLSKGKEALVDADMYEYLTRWRWCARLLKRTNTYYASRTSSGRAFQMHREVLGVAHGDPRVVDHINGDGLDNRRSNLRIASRQDNCRNSKKPRTNTSGLKGVSFRKDNKKWASYICIGAGKQIHLGMFESAVAAHAAYCEAAKIYHGEFARTT